MINEQFFECLIEEESRISNDALLPQVPTLSYKYSSSFLRESTSPSFPKKMFQLLLPRTPHKCFFFFSYLVFFLVLPFFVGPQDPIMYHTYTRTVILEGKSGVLMMMMR